MSNRAMAAFKYMLENPEHIEGVYSSGLEYYFKYRNHYFSVGKRTHEGATEYIAFVYPGYSGTVTALAKYFEEDFGGIDLVRYSSWDEGREALRDILQPLYDILSEKNLDIDRIFDDVMGN